MKQKGFTLIELLVVISIIGLLASVVLVSLNGSRTKARNVRRSADISQLAKAFNLGLDNNISLPDTGGNWVCVSSSCYAGWSGYSANSTVDAFLAAYIKKPSDPSDNSRGIGGYLYNSTWVGSGSFSAGSYLNWLEELPRTYTSCGSGQVYAAGASFVECLMKLN
ncbi:MAG: prepilin-type N-terminal cleavage/methylation domain-containing protein [Candidatus Doudnabacteria bacterium]